jgi:hypothetical protein
LVDIGNGFISSCIAASTRKTYQSGMNSYVQCFADFGFEAPFPATQTSLVMWLSHSATRAKQPLAPSTLRTYLSALVTLHQEIGFGSLLEDKPLVIRCFKGIKKSKGESTMVRHPITTGIIARFKTQLGSSFTARCYYAAATAATYALLRMGEFTVSDDKSSENAFKVLTLSQLKLKREDGSIVDLTNHAAFPTVTHYSLTLRTSKTDPFRKTVTIHVGHPIPVGAMLAYLRVYPNLHDLSAPLFRQSLSSLLPLKRATMIAVTRDLLCTLGYNQKDYHGHSFRRGGATSLANAGVAESVIQLVGRWASDAYKLYIVTPLVSLLNASRAM